MGYKCLAYPCDVSIEKDIRDTVAKVEKDFGTIDILVNNAGVVIGGATEEYSTEDWDKVFAVDSRGVFIMAREALKVMLKHGYGKIVNTASVAGLFGAPGAASYSASKASVINLTKALAAEYAAKGITVNAIAPGMFATEMTGDVTDTAADRTPMQRIGKPGELNGTGRGRCICNVSLFPSHFRFKLLINHGSHARNNMIPLHYGMQRPYRSGGRKKEPRQVF